MTISLGPMIQVLSCLLHSTQSTYTSSIRPRASLYCRYSVQHINVCVCVYVCMGARCEAFRPHVFTLCSLNYVHIHPKQYIHIFHLFSLIYVEIKQLFKYISS